MNLLCLLLLLGQPPQANVQVDQRPPVSLSTQLLILRESSVQNELGLDKEIGQHALTLYMAMKVKLTRRLLQVKPSERKQLQIKSYETVIEGVKKLLTPEAGKRWDELALWRDLYSTPVDRLPSLGIKLTSEQVKDIRELIKKDRAEAPKLFKAYSVRRCERVLDKLSITDKMKLQCVLGEKYFIQAPKAPKVAEFEIRVPPKPPRFHLINLLNMAEIRKELDVSPEQMHEINEAAEMPTTEDLKDLSEVVGMSEAGRMGALIK